MAQQARLYSSRGFRAQERPALPAIQGATGVPPSFGNAEYVAPMTASRLNLKNG